MTHSHILPPLHVLKDHARRLRSRLERDGSTVSHSKALELVAEQHGFRDWNTLHAAASKKAEEPPVALGRHVAGRYLGQPFTGEVIGLQTLAGGKRHRVTIAFDEPVDVVTFDSFSALRRRAVANIDASGRTVEKTSNGRPHLELSL
jgi:hypothetical protein